MTRATAGAAFLLGLTLFAYAGAGRAAFVWDDRPVILNNSRVTQPEPVWRYWTDPHLIGGHELRGFRPLTMASFAWNYRLAGPSRAVFHWTSVGLHLLTVFGVWTLGKRLLNPEDRVPGKGDAAALLAAGLFAVHPAMSQAVLFLTARSSLIAACGTIYATIFYDITLQSKHEVRFRAAYVGFLLAWLVALSGKESAIAGAILFAGLEWYRGRGLPDRRAGQLGAVRRLALPALIGVAYILWVLGAVQAQSTTPPARSWAANLMGQLGAGWEYTTLLAWPSGLALVHGADDLATAWTPEATLGLGVVLLMLGVAWAQRGRRPLVSLGLIAALIVIGPESYALPLKIVVNEHRLYLPAACLGLALAGGLAGIPDRRFRVARLVMLGLIALATVATALRVRTWASPSLLWEDAWRKYPSDCRAPAHLGQLTLEAGRPDAAVRYLEAATACNPVRLEPRLLLVGAYSQTGRHAEAMRLGTDVLADFPQDTGAHATLGTAYAAAGRVSEAIPHWERALELDPGNLVARKNLEHARGENL